MFLDLPKQLEAVDEYFAEALRLTIADHHGRPIVVRAQVGDTGYRRTHLTFYARYQQDSPHRVVFVRHDHEIPERPLQWLRTSVNDDFERYKWSTYSPGSAAIEWRELPEGRLDVRHRAVSAIVASIGFVTEALISIPEFREWHAEWLEIRANYYDAQADEFTRKASNIRSQVSIESGDYFRSPEPDSERCPSCESPLTITPLFDIDGTEISAHRHCSFCGWPDVAGSGVKAAPDDDARVVSDSKIVSETIKRLGSYGDLRSIKRPGNYDR